MKAYDELKAAIERYGVHPVFGGAGELDAWIEQNPHELATFLVAMQDLGVQSVLEIGTGWKGGLSRFLAAELGWDVTTVDIEDYGHKYPGVKYIISVEKPVSDYSYDLVWIDAKPTYEAAQANWTYYSEYALKIIALHDIAGLRECQGVTEFWHDVAYDGDSLRPGAYEIIDDSDQRGGIGYVVLAEYEVVEEAPIKEVPVKKAAPRKAPAKTSKPKAKSA